MLDLCAFGSGCKRSLGSWRSEQEFLPVASGNGDSSVGRTLGL